MDFPVFYSVVSPIIQFYYMSSASKATFSVTAVIAHSSGIYQQLNLSIKAFWEGCNRMNLNKFCLRLSQVLFKFKYMKNIRNTKNK
jgi:hypothetical protein